jgi:hypothetical protein
VSTTRGVLTGRGRYVDDLTLRRMVHVAFVRSIHATLVCAASVSTPRGARPAWPAFWRAMPSRGSASPLAAFSSTTRV